MALSDDTSFAERMDIASILYFAYGSNMAVAQMATRCPDARPVGTGTLPDHRFRINRAGVATIVADRGGCIYGLLWDLQPPDLDALDRYEGVASGQYIRTEMAVSVEHAMEPVTAQVYVASDDAPGAPRPEYLELIVTAAISLALPPTYVNELKAWGWAR